MLGPLSSDAQSRQAEYRLRKSRYAFETYRKDEAKHAVSNGWELVRENQNTDRYQKLKSHDEQLENEFWCLVYSLGYPTLNMGRNFEIQITSNATTVVSKQIDVFAIDQQTVLVVECKSAEKRIKRSLQKDIGDFVANQKPISNTLRKFFGKDFEQKIIWIFCTRNIEWSEQDRARAVENNIRIITERELLYYKEIAKRLGPAARHQFHAEFLDKTKVSALEHKIFALRTKIGPYRAFTFFADPNVILPTAFVNHRELADPNAAPSYQRLIHRPRIKSIADFLRKGGFFPNSVILNFKKKVRFDPVKPDDGSGVVAGELTLPNLYKTAWIIDGQHRLYGYTELDADDHRPMMPFLAFENIPVTEETRIFSDINSKQKSVQKKLLDEITGEIKLDSHDKKDQLRAIASRTCELMRDSDTGPLADKIAGVELKQSEESIITVTYLVDAINQAKLIGQVSSSNGTVTFNQGYIRWTDPKEGIAALAELLEGFFDLFRTANPQRWEQGKVAKFPTNVGAAALIRLLGDIIAFMQQKEHVEPRNLHPSQLVDRVEKYVQPCLDYFKTSSLDEMSSRFYVPFGSGGPKIFQHRLRELIFQKFPDFSPAGFVEDLRKYDADRRKEADQNLAVVLTSVRQFVLRRLRSLYPGDEDYFRKAVDNKDLIKSALMTQLEADDGDKDLGHHVDFKDLRLIVESPKHWQFFKDSLNIKLPEDPSGKQKYIFWFEQVGKLKKAAEKPHNRGYDDASVNMLNAVREALTKRGVINE